MAGSPEAKQGSEIYVSKSDGSLRMLHPEHSFDHLPSRVASNIRAQSEVYGVSHFGAQTGYGFRTKDSQYFEIITDGWEEKYATPEFEVRLAREVEARVGKEGLKIILY